MTKGDPIGATAVSPEELRDLLPGHIQTRDALNVWEQQNILEAARWANTSRADPLEESFVRELHRRMFSQTWRWAGRYRLSDKNIGVDWPAIPSHVRVLLGDGRYWLEHGTFSIDEAALRLHHRMVEIHLFPNGNGRHGRLWCDALLRHFKRPPIEWKSRDLDNDSGARTRYIHTLRSADQGDYSELVELFLTNRR